ncbi:MAG: hypothetical protein ACLFTR_01460 [Candidatus Woesearchaeota archaeon]
MRQKYSIKKHMIKVIHQEPVNKKNNLITSAGTEKVCACDFYVENSERWLTDGHILKDGYFLNIDHHSTLQGLQKHISSGNIAASYVKRYGVLGDDYVLLLNHLDCDSVITAFLMLGIIEPEKRFLRSVIAADHTGEKDKIADLLQALEDTRNLDFIAENLFKMIDGEELQERASRMLSIREKNRERIASMVSMNRIHKEGNVSYIITDSKLDPALLISLLPASTAIMISSKSEKKGHWNHRIRLGMHVQGISMKELDLPGFGGRWNAGSTRRNGGTELDPKEYARIINQRLKEHRIQKIV